MINFSSLATYDVCIAGGGLAGLCLARQIRLDHPELSVIVLDRQARPLSAGAHKVGESSIEAGSHYLMHTLGLKDYFSKIHKFKCGLRFFTGSSELPLQDRTETGSPDFPAIPALQIDRGILENDLRQMCEDMGVTMVEGVSVKNVVLGADSSEHVVTVEGGDQRQRTVRARWFIDAMGRRRFLARKLDLMEEVTHKASACWWRLPGKWDLTEAVPEGAEAGDWFDRELGMRWHATNHFLGKGYWVWVIPVASHTSIGIVSDETIHPVSERNSPAKAKAWLEKNEPMLAKWMAASEPSDFLMLKNFAYSCKQLYSSNRWACVGEAALFADPYYSTGTDLIALQNNVISRLIGLDKNQALTDKVARSYSEMVREFYRGVLAIYDGQYALFGNEYVHFQKTMWDYDYITGAMGKVGFAPHILDDVALIPEITVMLRKWSDLNLRVQKLLREWAEQAPGKMLDRGPGSKLGANGMLVPNMPVFQTFTDQLKVRSAQALVDACSGSLFDFALARATALMREASADLRSTQVYSGISGETWQKFDEVRIASLSDIELSPDAFKRIAESPAPHDGRHVCAGFLDYQVPAMPPCGDLVGNYPRPIDLFWSNVEATPEKTAVVYGRRRLSYGDLGAMASRVAAGLKATSLPRGAVVCADVRCPVERLAILVGTMLAGGVFVHAPEGVSPQRAAQDVAATYLVCSQEGLHSEHVNVLLASSLLNHEQDGFEPKTANSVASRVATGFGRYLPDTSPTCQWITHFSLMNFYWYTELALRPSMAFAAEDAVAVKPVMLTTTRACEDWLFPLVYGGILVLGEPGVSAPQQVRAMFDEASTEEGLALVSGTVEHLLKLAGDGVFFQGIKLLSIGAGTRPHQARALSAAADYLVDAGVIEWGHEDLWGKKIKALAIEGR
jgi:flavin-dependent dehydrogenase